MSKLMRGTRAGLMVLLVALVMLFADVPASAGGGGNGGGGQEHGRNATWE
jgi:hypothetical protein